MTAIADLPGPPGLPGIGNAFRIRPDRLHVIIEQWGRRYGPVFRFAMGPRTVVGFTEPDAINQILRERPDGYRRWREVEAVASEIGIVGPFTSEGEDWRRQRRLAVTALNSNHLRRYFEIIALATERLHARLERTPETAILEDFMSYSVDVTSALAFGHDLNTLERGDGELQEHIARVFELLSRRILAPVPYWRVVKPPADRAAEHSLEVLREQIAGFIGAARTRMDARPELHDAPENFLESMLAAPERYSDADVTGNVFTMLFAGEDTTANTLAWATAMLAQNPQAQGRLAAEADAVLGAAHTPRTAEDADAMHFGEAVFREAARLKSVAPIIFVEPNADTSVAGVELPAGTRIAALTRQAGRPEKVARFDPDRWLDGENPVFLPFGAGPRFCPGRNLAFLEAKAALAMLARNFTWKLAGPPPRERFGFTMGPAGLRVALRPRMVPASKL
ncbi:cytochrome P450 [Solirubrobacter ginsenosidimutans]|uniref:Cytochrome P450 n=1 Tax=Solirubrobacter ginsenosidimutans TaxID=490573 RepID=A0A9X3MVV4_9ACTN|nr:cytochrome P450 [Solirubrobacter ginsenosidimutans]MDA0163669.1 cytochrome P450 [Solirubrobacter ginsenosidimutans]